MWKTASQSYSYPLQLPKILNKLDEFRQVENALDKQKLLRKTTKIDTINA